MKRIFFPLLLLAVGQMGAAQTNSPDVLGNIHSDSGTFSLVGARAIYQGNVHADNPRMKLTCAWLVADLPHDNKPDRHVVATTNVVVDLSGGTNQSWHVTSDQAVYDFKLAGGVTNEIVTASGNAKAESDKYIVTGEPLIYDMQSHLFSGTNYTTIFKSSPPIPGGTNGSGAKTNASAAHSFF
jgi:lipopolysaccharide export system protein LptA